MPGEMATSVAHELNQPLNVIRMSAGNAKLRIDRGAADPVYLEDKLQRIETQTLRAAGIIERLRSYGRKESGDDQDVDLIDAIRLAIGMFRSNSDCGESR